MSISLQWRYGMDESGWILVADNLQNYRAEIAAIALQSGLNRRAWAIYEYQQLLIQGVAKDTETAKQQCARHIRIAQQYPRYPRLATGAPSMIDTYQHHDNQE